MTDEAQRWKEKYLKSIEQQDKLERRWNARLDLLRRGLVRSSLAAEGADKAVDQCMKEMREIVRKDDMDAGLAALIPRLETAVLESEQRREKRVEQMGSALTSLVTQLQTLPLPKEVSRPLRQLAKGLEERVNQARELPLLLGELSGLQGQALALLEHPELNARPGFLQRLFGGRDASEPVPEEEHSAPQKANWANEAPAPSGPPDVPTIVAADGLPAVAAPAPEPPAVALPPPIAQASAPVPVEPAVIDTVLPEREAAHPNERVIEPDVPAREVETTGQTAESASEDELEPQPEPEPDAAADVSETTVPHEPHDSIEGAIEDAHDDVAVEEVDVEHAASEVEDDTPFALPSSPEPTYSSVAAHIEQTLLGLLNDLTLPEHHRPQAEAMRARLENGLNWYELLPILDDLAVLMLAINDSGQHEFEVYLKHLNDRLESFQSSLLAATTDHADTQSVSRQQSDQLREHVGGMQSSVQDAADFDSLKHTLESRFEGLIAAMDQHQKERDEREQDVASQLLSLVGRVATMEQEAQGFRLNLEEQRQKALIDTLTGLPNRAAWSERLDHEIQQLQITRQNLLMGILDLDHFKRINDGYGHLAGDKVLKIVAGQLKKRLRPNDFIARFGGEEFVFLLPDTLATDGMALLEHVRASIEQCPFHFKGEPVTITVSMGITPFKAGERSDVVLKRADEALYRAKAEGRNRIEQG